MSTHDHRECLVSTQNPFPQGRDTHWRMCYARELAAQGQANAHRLRDERTGELWFVDGYEGDIMMNRMDGGSHEFHDGPVYVDEHNMAHLMAREEAAA